MSIELSEDQQIAYDFFNKWLDKPKGVETLAGYAGTGKSTVLSKILAERADIRFAAAAYTGKAANNIAMRIGGAPNVKSISTIHKLIYDAREDEDEGKFVFERKEIYDVRRKVDVIVLDEASMISDDLLDEIKTIGLPIWAIGDHGQLPPIEGESSIMKNPSIRLERIHRQAEGSPIIALSKYVREKGKFPVPPPKGVRHLSWGRFKEEIAEFAAHATEAELLDTAILSYTNRVRSEVNRLVRTGRFGGSEGETPYPGEIVVSLRNYQGVFNGMRGIVKSATKGPKHHDTLEVDFPFEKMNVQAEVLRAQFGREKTFSSQEELREAQLPFRRLTELGALYDYGYAMTVHKAQGSGFKRVYVIKEHLKKVDDETYKRWAYTAVTRAIDELAIVVR